MRWLVPLCLVWCFAPLAWAEQGPFALRNTHPIALLYGLPRPLGTNLPEATGDLQQPEDQSIVVTIAEDGSYAVNDQALVNNQLATLMRALQQQMGENDAPIQLIITADANATHQAVVRAMDAAGQVGLTSLSITTQAPKEEP